MKIGIIGTGSVGGTLGKLWAYHDHEIVFGARDVRADKVLNLLAKAGPNARADNIADAVAFGDVVVLAVPATATSEALQAGGDWNSKILVDATNRFGMIPNGAASQAVYVAQLAKGAKVVKAFNTIGANLFAEPKFRDVTASIFLCGDDADAKSKVAGLAEELGFEVVDCGGLSSARMVEALGELWVHLARTGMGRNHAFKLLHK